MSCCGHAEAITPIDSCTCECAGPVGPLHVYLDDQLVGTCEGLDWQSLISGQVALVGCKPLPVPPVLVVPDAL
jgi:hypothetical protein